MGIIKNETLGINHEVSLEIAEQDGINQLKSLLKENYNCMFKSSDKRNSYFNDVEIAKGEFIYKRVLIGKEDVNFELKIISEILAVLNGRTLMPNEMEAIKNKNFRKVWSCNEKKVLRLSKKGYIFELALSVYYI